MSGVDSAYGPNAAQVQAFHDKGYSWWGWYAGGRGCYHQWTDQELAALADNGVTLTVPIFVPAMMAHGVIDHHANPEADARLAVYFTGLRGWEGVMALDTEHSMRNDAWTVVYEARFGDEVLRHGWQAVTYAGGFTLSHPPKHTPWWIIPGDPPEGVAYQWGQDDLAGRTVDIDHAGSGFPLATRTH